MKVRLRCLGDTFAQFCNLEFGDDDSACKCVNVIAKGVLKCNVVLSTIKHLGHTRNWYKVDFCCDDKIRTLLY